MTKLSSLLVAFIMCSPAYGQTTFPSSGDAVKDAATVLGAINWAKLYAERCFSTSAIRNRQNVENVVRRLHSYEILEIEMHYYIVREIMNIQHLSSETAARMMQEMMLKLRQEYAAQIDTKTLPSGCSNFATNVTSKAGDFTFMYASQLNALRLTENGVLKNKSE